MSAQLADSSQTDEQVDCPGCGRKNTSVRHKAFGGHWRDVCKDCGHTLARGRDE